MNEIKALVNLMLCCSVIIVLSWPLDRFIKFIIKQVESKRSAGGWNALKMLSLSKEGRTRIAELQVMVQQLNMSLSQKERSYECLLALQGATQKRLSEAESALAAQERKIKYAEEQNKGLSDKLLRAGDAAWGVAEIKRRDEKIGKLHELISELKRIGTESNRVMGLKIMRIGALEDQLRQMISAVERLKFKDSSKEGVDEGLEELSKGIKYIKTLL